jgi:NADH:ubiquinone oxidoreductase subunit 6 (subunit J)
MERQNTDIRNLRRVAVAVITGFAAAALFYTLDGEIARGCSVLHAAGWVVLQVLRPVMVAGWQSVAAYLPENAGCFQQLPQIVASVGPVLCALAA